MGDKNKNLKVMTLDERQRRLIDYKDNEVQLLSSGHDSIDDYWKFLKGNCTDITGYPYSGKTLWMMEILWNLSTLHGIRHLIHLPDSGKQEEIDAILLQKMTGKTFDKRYKNQIEEEEIYKHMNFIDEHFKILEYHKRPNPKEFWDYSIELGVDTACIDSWNYMRHDGEGTRYLADVLSYRNELAEKHNKHFFTIIHPRNPTAQDYDSNGQLKPCDVYSLMGGSEWNNNGKNIVVLHKDSKEGTAYDIYHRKIKPRIVGKTGYECLNYDIERARFYQLKETGKGYIDRHYADGTIIRDEDAMSPYDPYEGLTGDVSF